MTEQSTQNKAEDILNEQQDTVQKQKEETGRWMFSRLMDEKGYTGAYERYHTNHESSGSSVKLSPEKKQEIRERVARTLAERVGQTGSIFPTEAVEKPAQQETVNETDDKQTAIQMETPKPTDGSEVKQENTEKQEMPEHSDKRGIVTGECEGEPFNFTDFKMKRANAVKEFFNNMHEFTFTRTNQEAVEMLHMHQQKNTDPDAQKSDDSKAAPVSQESTFSAEKERAQSLYHIITGEKRMTVLRLIVTAVLFALSLLFFTVKVADGKTTLCGFVLSGRIIAAIELLVLVLGGVASSNTYVGTWQLIKNKRFGKEILAALIYTAGVLFGIFTVIMPSVMLKEYYTSYTPWYLLTVCGYHLGMRLQMGRLQKQFEMTVSEQSALKYSLEPLENRFLLQNLDVQRKENSLVVKQVKADMLAGFEEHGFAPDWFDALTKPFVIALTAVAAVAAIGSWVLSGDWMKAVFVFAGAFAFCSPFAAMYAAELPMGRFFKEQQEVQRNIRQNYTVLHADAVEDMADAGAVIIGSEALFPPESVILHGLRSAAGVRVDEAILDAVSILTAGKSILAPTFLQMISDKTELLKPVDSITYEDGMGISAWVDDNRVLIGSRKLMENHNIRMPSKEIEQAEADKGRMILYLARRGELITAFTLTLNVLPQVKRLLGQARSQGMRLYIKSVDCLIENNLQSLFGEDADIIGILPSRLHTDYDKETNRQDSALSLILSDGSAFSALHTVMQLQRLRASLEINRLLAVILLAVTGIYFSAAAMAGNPVLTASATVVIPALLHAAFFLPKR